MTPEERREHVRTVVAEARRLLGREHPLVGAYTLARLSGEDDTVVVLRRNAVRLLPNPPKVR